MAYNIVLNKKECEIDGVKCAFPNTQTWQDILLLFIHEKDRFIQDQEYFVKRHVYTIINNIKYEKNVQQQQKHF